MIGCTYYGEESNFLWANSPTTKNKHLARIKIGASVAAEHLKKNICESQVQKLPLQEFRKGNVFICSACWSTPCTAVPSNKFLICGLCYSTATLSSEEEPFLEISKSQVSTITAGVTATTVFLFIWLLHFLFSKGEIQLGSIALSLSGSVSFQTSARKFISVYVYPHSKRNWAAFYFYW